MRVKNGRFHKQLVSSFCGKKEHSFHELHPALSILSVTKDKEGERRHLIDGGLRRKNLSQRRASRASSSPIWDAGKDSPTRCGHLRDVGEGERKRLFFFSPHVTFILFSSPSHYILLPRVNVGQVLCLCKIE